jgi:hypothetical protein
VIDNNIYLINEKHKNNLYAKKAIYNFENKNLILYNIFCLKKQFQHTKPLFNKEIFLKADSIILKNIKL